MGRKPKLNPSKRFGYNATIGGKRYYFGRIKSEAEKEFTKTYSDFLQGHLPKKDSDTIRNIVADFLDYVEATSAEKTLKWYREPLNRFVKYTGPTKKFSDLSKSHLEIWLAKDWGIKKNGKKCSPNSLRQGVRAVKRCFGEYAEQKNTRSPFKDVAVGIYTPSKTLPTEKQLAALIEYFKHDENFTDLISFLVSSGCRVWEIRHIRCDQVKFDKNIIQLDADQTKNYKLMAKKEMRKIRLNPDTIEICRRNIEKNKTGYLFQNPEARSSNNCWHTETIRQRFLRAKKKLKFYFPFKAIRHYWATSFLRANGNIAAGAKILGHTSTKMLLDTYNQIESDTDFLNEQANLVKPIRAAK
jgi:integrase